MQISCKCDVPNILRVIAAASAPLLISVGSGRVLRGVSFSSAGLPVTPEDGCSGNNETVVMLGCVGRAILLERSWVVLVVEELVENDAGVGDAIAVG